MDKTLKNLLICVGLLILSLFVIKYIFIYLSPFIIATVLAALIDPLVNKLNKIIPIHRGFIVLIVLFLLISILIILMVLGISQIYLELNNLLQNLPDYNTFGNQFQWLIEQNNQVQHLIDNLDISPNVKDFLNSQLQRIYDSIKDQLVILINSILNFLTKLPLVFTISFLSFIASFFISRDKKQINNFIIKLFPEQWKPKIYQIRNELMDSAMGFIRAELILISITGIITGIGLKILGYNYALIIGISAAMLDLIPIIGPALIFIPWIIYNFISGHISSAIALLTLQIILAAVRSGSEGKVMGESLGIHPLSTMIALYVGYRILGGLGFIVGPTILIIIKALAIAEVIPFYSNYRE